MFRITILDEDLELGNKTKIQLNKMLFDIQDVTKRGVLFTNSIQIPFTKQNDRLLGYPSRLSSNNRPFETTPTYKLLNQTQILSNGKVIIKSFDDKNGIKIQLSEGVGFWQQAEAKQLNDMVLHSHDFVFNSTNMDALKSRGSSVFVACLSTGAGALSGAEVTAYTFIRPTYNWRILLDTIASELGYTIDYGDVLTLTDLLNLGNASNAQNFFVSDFKYSFTGTSVNGLLDISAGTSVFTKAGNVSLATDTLTNALFKTSYVIKGTVTSPIDTAILVNVNSNVERIIIKAGANFINFRSDEVKIGTTVQFETEVPITFDSIYIYSAISEGNIIETNGSFDISGYLVLSDYNLPNQTYKQFIKNIFALQFMDAQIDELLKTITFRYLPSVINSNNVVDMPGKIDRYFPVESGVAYGKQNLMSYANDPNIDQTLGAYLFAVDNDAAKGEADFIKLDSYSASREIEVSGETVISMDIYNRTDFKRVSVKDRIVYMNETGSFGINAQFTPISFTRIFSDRYFPYVNATKRERVVQFNAWLKNIDFNNIQNNPLIYIDYLQSVFLVTEIEGFDNKNLAKITAIKYN